MAVTSCLGGNLLVWCQYVLPGLPFTGSAYRAPNGEVVWIDPPDAGADEAILLGLGTPGDILITFRDHDRAVERYAQRFNARVWIPRGHGGGLRHAHAEYDAATALPAGLNALGLPACGYGEHALYTEAYGERFAFIGDALFNFSGTGVPIWLRRLAFRTHGGPLEMKRQYRGGETARVVGQIQQLLPLRLTQLYLSHGYPITEGADAEIRLCLGIGPDM